MVRSRGSGASLRVDAFRVNEAEVITVIAAAAPAATAALAALLVPAVTGSGEAAGKSVVWAMPTTCSGESNGLLAGS